MIHTAYLIAKRGEYAYWNLEKRKKVFWSLFYFAKRSKIKTYTIIINKRFKNRKMQLRKEATIQIHKFFTMLEDYMEGFEKVTIYYDNGQETLASILDNFCQAKKNVEHKIIFNHIEERLFQVADMLTVIEKIIYKHKQKIPLTNAELHFFQIKEILNMMRELKSKKL